jgi:DNA-binding transcriptional regulator PaaX
MKQTTRDNSSAIIDGMLKFLAGGGFLTTALLVPNAAKVFDKRLNDYLKRLDQRSRERELRRIAHYMKQKGLISYQTKDYEHGIKLTKAGKLRLKKQGLPDLSIAKPRKWDKHWRLVFFDVPIEDNSKRHSLTFRLRQLGFIQLQKSIWVHPFPCRAEIEALGEALGIRKYITYVEVAHIDSEDKLRARFKKVMRK